MEARKHSTRDIRTDAGSIQGAVNRVSFFLSPNTFFFKASHLSVVTKLGVEDRIHGPVNITNT